MRINDWYVGVVEDTNDPQGQGRVRVRCLGYHTPDRNKLPTQDLPLATVILPTTSASVAGIGLSSTGLIPNTWVFGFFRDGVELQDPVILGTIASASGYDLGYDVTANMGFGDPHGALNGFIGNDIPPEAGTGTSRTGGSVANSLGAANAMNGAYNNSNPVSTSFDQPIAPLPSVGSNPSANFISVARTQIGVKETSKNQGPGIEKYWTATSYGISGYAAREPWCAAFMSWVIKQSGVIPSDQCPNTASAFNLRDWGKSKAFAKVQENPRYVRAGDILVYSCSHAGLAVTDSDASGAFTSISGNHNNAVLEGKSYVADLTCTITISDNASKTPTLV